MNCDLPSDNQESTYQPKAGKRRHETELRLLDELYRKYAWGGTKFSRLQNQFYYIHKKYGWLMVTRSAHVFKRSLDIIVSAVMLIALSPLFLVTALAIRLDNAGPVFYAQTRVGNWGNLFKIYKFRSMIVNADKIKSNLLSQNESGGVNFKMKHDPRITRVGRIIRKVSIDELPQLWNVLKGDMSLVGPRPPLPNEVEQYEYADRRRLEVTPGITCIWQVSGRSELDFKQQVSLDVEYIESQSFWQDIKILFKTIPAVLLGKGAY
jgi:exopolysaccharide biosynthesis polyprenyl glycosylphosphotransferase